MTDPNARPLWMGNAAKEINDKTTSWKITSYDLYETSRDEFMISRISESISAAFEQSGHRELLAACERAVKDQKDSVPHVDCCCWCCEMEAAIAKAKGEACQPS